MEDLVDKKFSSYENLKKYKDYFPHQGELILTLEKNSEFSGEDICIIRKWIEKEKNINWILSDSFSFMNLRRAESEGEKLFYPQLYNDGCEANSLLSKIHHPYTDLFIPNKHNIVLFLNLVKADLGKFGHFDPSFFEKLKKDFKQDVSSKISGMKSSWGGQSVFEYYNYQGIQDGKRMNLTVVICVIILLKLLFGSFKPGLSFVFVMMLISSSLFLIMSILGYAIDPLSNNLFLVTIIAALEDFIFIWKSFGKNKGHWKKAFENVLLPSFFTSVTTVVGFWSLWLSELDTIKHFGLLAGIGAILEWYLLFSLLPSIVTVFNLKIENWRGDRNISNKLGSLLNRLSMPKALGWSLLLIIPIGASLVSGLNYYNNFENFFPPEHEYSIDNAKIAKQTEIKSYISLIFDEVVSENEITSIVSTLEKEFGPSFIENPLILRNDFLKNVSIKHEKVALLDFERSTKRYFSEDGHKRFIFYFNNNNTELFLDIDKRVKKLCPKNSCFLAGNFHSFAEFNEKVMRTLNKSLFTCMLLVAGLLIFISYSLKRDFLFSFKLTMSSLWGPFAVLIVLYLFRTPIFFISSICFAYLIGLTGDNAIQFLLAGEKQVDENMEHFGVSSLAIALIMSCMSLAFLTAYFYPPRILGKTLILGFLFSFIGDFWIFRALLRKDLGNDKKA